MNPSSSCLPGGHLFGLKANNRQDRSLLWGIHIPNADKTNNQGSAINLDDIKRFEVTEVYSHPDAKVDIGMSPFLVVRAIH